GRNSWRHAWQLGRARWVVTNERFISRLPKREGQQLVVAAFEVPLVRSGRDNPDWVLQPTSERRPSRSQVERWDLAVTSSPFATQVLRSSSGYEGPVLEGVSAFADAMAAALSEPDLHDRLELVPSLPLVLLALRSAQTQLSVESLTHAFAGRLQFVVVTDDLSRSDAKQVVDDLPSWCAAADLMVTEWSSLTMEFAGLQRPILAFQADALDVVRRRGTYADLPKVLPGPCVGSTGELIERLESWLAHGDHAWPEFVERSAAFATLGCRSTGDAAVRILEAMEGAR
ncbi:MAG: CDP-glycerol glycerophosphotransferase family protein, partial [Actinomycetota bacterium]|nr:CDP-glycerol glycerophosphotransferase family protein [Actinomycetota bacterium]